MFRKAKTCSSEFHESYRQLQAQGEGANGEFQESKRMEEE
jgi:hypothetical protein